MKSAAFLKADLKQLQYQLSDWRRKQTGRVRLPEGMWSAATQLARTHGTGLERPHKGAVSSELAAELLAQVGHYGFSR